MSDSDQDDVAGLALSAFDQLVTNTSGFRSRPGQRMMAERIAQALSSVTLGDHPSPDKAIAVIQAGTGVGKSAAYLSTTVAMALHRQTRVVVSTATVALQEQLMTKDLPALATALDVPIVYALAKGRGRYVCRFKLERLTGLEGDLAQELFGMDAEVPPEPPNAFVKPTKGSDWHNPLARRMRLYGDLAESLARGHWDGDRDSLALQPDSSDWSAVAAERHTCTARHCPNFRDCCYYSARLKLSEAQVIVANHDLVLASIGMKSLPDLDNCLLVFDEGHHLPAVALDQFSCSMDLSNLRWIEKLPTLVAEVCQKLGVSAVQDAATLAQQLRIALQDVGRMATGLLTAADNGFDTVHRFADGALDASLHEPIALVQRLASGLLLVFEALATEIKARTKEDPSQASSGSVMLAGLGLFAARLKGVTGTCRLLLQHDPQPLAKWLKSSIHGGLVYLSAHACPIVPGDLLRLHLWSQVRAAVITSASLNSCGSFDYFLAEAGLDDLPHASTLAVESPFDYHLQGQLVVVMTASDPKQVAAYTQEMVAELLQDVRQVQHGALALFTSRVQMQAAVDALDADLQERVLVQGQMARTRLLSAHQARVESGQASIIFGMQSFGEGLDLPGTLCETVFIAKLPFASPADPVAEARSEWLKREGRDPFSELVVPATGIRLLQWTGRAIRTEEDLARVICYDKRLLTTAFGRRMLQGLPPYLVLRRTAGDAQPEQG